MDDMEKEWKKVKDEGGSEVAKQHAEDIDGIKKDIDFIMGKTDTAGVSGIPTLVGLSLKRKIIRASFYYFVI